MRSAEPIRGLPRWFTYLVLLTLMTPVAAGAQQAPGTVPEEFLRAFVGADANLLIGELPADLRGLIELPEGARIIGSVVYEERSMAFVTSAADAEATVAFFRDELAADGWRLLVERSQPRGFQRPETGGASVTACGEAGELFSISAGPGADNTIARLQYYAEFPGPLPCDRPRPGEMRGDELEERMPVLNLPPGEFRRNTSSGGGMDSRWSGVELRSDRTAARIAADLAEQLQTAGWVAGFEAGGAEAAITTWSRTFEDGFEARGVLTIIELGPGSYESLFRLFKIPPG